MISGFAPARLRSAERVLRIQRGQGKVAGIAERRSSSSRRAGVQDGAVLSGAASDVERMHVRACRSVNPVCARLGAEAGCVREVLRGGGRGAWLALALAGRD